ncbi:ATP-binding protein [Desulfovibrio cuneatus]|uniref:ATP-binding protein n=1 Tax=Desulfovibrio cuneatus TaxID=159728 RepID=UPI0004240AF7|nr:ATP-binding protein [Desulfovibrio cuneatus]
MSRYPLRVYAVPFLFSLVWLVLVFGLFQRGVAGEQQHAHDLVRLQARTLGDQMLDTRAWNTMHGGVYVKESEYGQANPWLPEAIQRATLQDGTPLVLMNPAYMSRQIADFTTSRGTQIRIVSHAPLNPKNKADAWEEEAIRALKAGQAEAFGHTPAGSSPASQNGRDIQDARNRQNGQEPLALQSHGVYRYMAPLPTEEKCLMCHKDASVGDVRGGISLTLNDAPFLGVMENHARTLSYFYGLMGFTGVMGIGGASYILTRKRLQAEEKARMQNAFLANMSHDMRTPISGIVSMSELLCENATPAKRTAAMYMHAAAAALLEMITDITTHAKLETGKFTLQEDVFLLAPALEQCLDMFRPVCREKGLLLSLTVAPDVPATLVGDSFRLRQALGNLVGNAVKFTQTGEVHLQVTCTSQHLGQPYVAGQEHVVLQIAVQDTGPGVPQEERDTIFERFTQGGAGKQQPGTGLGLGIARDIARLMGGSLWLEDAPGGGSVFTLRVVCRVPGPKQEPQKLVQEQAQKEHGTSSIAAATGNEVPCTTPGILVEAPQAGLPAQVVMSAQAINYASPAVGLSVAGQAPPPQCQAGSPSPLRILVAEDARVTTFFIGDVLERAGHEVCTVQSGTEALEALATQCFHLLLLDMYLPGKTGLEVLAHLKEMQPGRTLVMPVISMSATQDGATEQALLQAGACTHLTKPFTAAALLEVVHALYPKGEPVQQENDVFCMDEALERVEGNKGLLHHMAQLFLQELPGQRAALAQAVASLREDKVALVAHALKNSSGMLGLKRMQTTCAQLEEAATARADNLPWSVTDAAIGEAHSALQQFVGSQDGQPA